MHVPREARLVIGASESDADLFYATGFLAPDSFIFLQTQAEKLLLMSDLEVGRARLQARTDRVLSLSHYLDRAKREGIESPTSLDALCQLLVEKSIGALHVPRSFPIAFADPLRERGYTITFPRGPYWPEREIKTPEEIKHIRLTQKHTETAMDAAIGLIDQSQIQDGGLYVDGKPLTSEGVKYRILTLLMESGFSASHTIVACGDQACDPHHEGSGHLMADQPIIIDIFPKSNRSGYFADITRTVVKGQPSKALREIFDTVLEGQRAALAGIKAGADGKTIHQAVVDLFEGRDYKTGEVDGSVQGYFHSTGHGVGLEIHEAPRISKASQSLRAGHVVTVEPGLYYPGRGAVRLEDLVVVTESGCENLTRYPKFLQLG
ncbi:MAG: Xaa-Pro peptidase family protein [bacterium]|nr:Xaa-Pro peptidase family protein [bacterium]